MPSWVEWCEESIRWLRSFVKGEAKETGPVAGHMHAPEWDPAKSAYTWQDAEGQPHIVRVARFDPESQKPLGAVRYKELLEEKKALAGAQYEAYLAEHREDVTTSTCSGTPSSGAMASSQETSSERAPSPPRERCPDMIARWNADLGL